MVFICIGIFSRDGQGDTPEPGPVWRLNKMELNSDMYKPSMEGLQNLKALLNIELDKLIQ